MTTVAETERIAIRPWRPDEADRLFDILRRWNVVRWLGASPRSMEDRDEAVVRIERWAAGLAADPRYGAWAAVEKASGIPAGTVLLKPLPGGDGEVEIGWHFHPDSWGRGLASEAAGALLARGFEGGLSEVWAVTHLDNDASMAVCRRIGMRLLGVTRRWYHAPSRMFWAGARTGLEPSLAPTSQSPSPGRSVRARAETAQPEAGCGWLGPIGAPAGCASSGRSMLRCGRRFSSQAGIHHIAGPKMCITAGSSSNRMMNASMKIADAKPTPIIASARSLPIANAPKTAIMMIAAAVTTRPVIARPWRTA